MSAAQVNLHPSRWLVDDEGRGLGWAEYIELWLASHTPRQPALPATPVTQATYADVPWATACLMDAFNA